MVDFLSLKVYLHLFCLCQCNVSCYVLSKRDWVYHWVAFVLLSYHDFWFDLLYLFINRYRLPKTNLPDLLLFLRNGLQQLFKLLNSLQTIESQINSFALLQCFQLLLQHHIVLLLLLQYMIHCLNILIPI